ncbi:MAG: hypothetical protein LBI43_01710 [Streptococcaceae bacterium]|jgi:hypothetical protein|nr:hypothetical protein [Streptococcaceae bacterium]
MNTSIIVSLIVGMALGALLFILGLYLFMRYDENRFKKQLAVEKLHKEIDVRRNLNAKVIEILNRPVSESDWELIDPRADVKVAFADYQFLKNFTSLHTLYIPGYFMDQFFTSLSNHLAIFDDDGDLKNGGYIFKESRPIFEDFSVTITEEMEAKKAELDKTKNLYPALLKRQNFNL